MVKNCNNVIFSAFRIFLMVLWSESKNRHVSNVWNTFLLVFWFGSYEQLRSNSHGNWWLSVCGILFLSTIADITTHNAHQNLSKFQIISNLTTVKICACLSKLPGTELKVSVVHKSMAQFGVPCVKQGEVFCYFDCNFFYFGQINLSWYSR